MFAPVGQLNLATGAFAVLVASLAVALTTVATPIIGWLRWRQLQPVVELMRCRHDYQRFEMHWFARWTGGELFRPHGWSGKLTRAARCRLCGKHEPLAGVAKVVAVLDHGTKSESAQDDETLEINWTLFRQLFEFDRVEIKTATDAEVEEFIKQMQYESDTKIQSRLHGMPCRVSNECELTGNTLRLLENTFAKIE